MGFAVAKNKDILLFTENAEGRDTIKGFVNKNVKDILLLDDKDLETTVLSWIEKFMDRKMVDILEEKMIEILRDTLRIANIDRLNVNEHKETIYQNNPSGDIGGVERGICTILKEYEELGFIEIVNLNNIKRDLDKICKVEDIKLNIRSLMPAFNNTFERYKEARNQITDYYKKIWTVDS